MSGKKILVIGIDNISGVDCIGWDIEDPPNIPDYEIVILNAVSMSNYALRIQTQQKIGAGLRILLNSQGSLVAIGCPQNNIKVKTFPYGENNVIDQPNNIWFPFEVGINNESGDTIKFDNDIYKEYFQYVKKWNYYFTLGGDKLRVVDCVKNRYDKLLAGTISKGSGGKFVFLPCPTEISDVEAVQFILKTFFEVTPETSPPDWTESLKIPGLEDIERRIIGNEDKINNLSEANRKLEKKASDLKKYQKLLYETGSALEEIVRDSFILLNHKPESPKFKEEYIIKSGNKIGIIECKGKEKSISRKDFRQLLDYHKEYQIDFDGDFKGILIGNAWRLKPVKDRNKNEFPTFPDDVKKIATKNDFALLSTVELFNIICKFIEKKIESKEIIKKLFEAKGVVKF